MKKLLFICLITGLIYLSLVPEDALSSGIEEQPPVVVTTVPASGAKDVDPSIAGIRVTFSREMMDKSWSWVQIAPENFAHDSRRTALSGGYENLCSRCAA